MHNKYKYFKQREYIDCGPTCLKMIASYYGKDYSLDYLKSNFTIDKNGVDLLGLSEVAKKIGFKTLSVKLTYNQLIEEVPLPCILHWNEEHYVVLYEVKYSYPGFFPGKKRETFIIADPGSDIISVDKETLEKGWLNLVTNKGIALLIDPDFDQLAGNTSSSSGLKSSIRKTYTYLRNKLFE